MRRIFMCFVALAMVFSPIKQKPTVESNVPSKSINLVYDDSGSMIYDDEVGKTDRWCQAKYSLEVISAMLGEQDVLNVYYMSSYSNGEKDTKPQLSIKGSASESGVQKNVAQVHNHVTYNGKTPFNAVKVAYEALKSASTDEKWLVVLTDGKFNETTKEEASAFYDDVVADGKTKVMLLFMGQDVDVIDSKKNITSFQAENTTDILEQLTELCNQIFQNNALDIDSKNLEMSFNIPMSELVVFAQGKDVSISNISGAKNNYKPKSNVKVQYSDVPTLSKKGKYGQQENWVVNSDLNGYVATFKNVPEGDYRINAKNVDSIQVYYKPDVEIAAYLYEGNKEVTAEETLVSGEYTVEYGFVKAGTNEKIKDTSLLGDIHFTSKIKNVGLDESVNEFEAEQGDTIKIKEGTLVIEARADYLDYNTQRTHLTYEIYASNHLSFKLKNKPKYLITTEGFQNSDKPLILEAKVKEDGGDVDLTETQWDLLAQNLEVTTKRKLGEFKIEKGDKVGTFNIYPSLYNDDPLQTKSGDIEIRVKGEFSQGKSAFKGDDKKKFHIDSDVSSLEKLLGFIQRHKMALIIGLSLFFILLGYVPGVKKYFPKNMAKSPMIECKPSKVGVKRAEAKGRFKKDPISTLIPYKAETATITFSPSPNKRSCKVKAIGGGRMVVRNPKNFVGKKEFLFGGSSIPAGQTKPIMFGSSQSISYKTDTYVYTCYLNRKKK